jgi:hypothetical protein
MNERTDWNDALFETGELARLIEVRARVTYGWQSDWPKDEAGHYVVDCRVTESRRPSIC